jgi:O-antigen ligase
LFAAFLAAFSAKLPWTVQRTLSFLPVKVDYVVASDAEGSTRWRIEMWKDVLPEIPKHPITGRGYSLDSDELWWISTARYLKKTYDSTGSAAASDFHSGPLSVIIPFGIIGSAAFLWFIFAAVRYLYGNYRKGNPGLKTVNTVLLTVFIAHTLSFFFIFGSLYSDLCMFTGLLGLSVSLNGRVEGKPEPAAEVDPAFAPFSSIADGKSSA